MEVKVIKSKFMHNLFDQNTYVVLNKKQAIIIDAGADLEDVKQVVGNRKVQAVLMTHLHFDHFWFLDEYLKEFNTCVYIKQGAQIKFSNSDLNGAVLVGKNIQKIIEENQIKFYEKHLKLGEFDCEIIETPGHAADCVCVLVENNLFTGDTIFADSIGRTDLKDSSKEQMLSSLKTIKNLDFEKVFPGHYNFATKNQIDKIIDFYL